MKLPKLREGERVTVWWDDAVSKPGEFKTGVGKRSLQATDTTGRFVEVHNGVLIIATDRLTNAKGRATWRDSHRLSVSWITKIERLDRRQG